MGGERYEMNELPDSMMDTTVFVGNLNEFVQDEDLSMLFQTVSSLQTLPACVVRKPDMSSLEYGFVSFPSVQEKEVSFLLARVQCCAQRLVIHRHWSHFSRTILLIFSRHTRTGCHYSLSWRRIQRTSSQSRSRQGYTWHSKGADTRKNDCLCQWYQEECG